MEAILKTVALCLALASAGCAASSPACSAHLTAEVTAELEAVDVGDECGAAPDGRAWRGLDPSDVRELASGACLYVVTERVVLGDRAVTHRDMVEVDAEGRVVAWTATVDGDSDGDAECKWAARPAAGQGRITLLQPAE